MLRMTYLSGFFMLKTFILVLMMLYSCSTFAQEYGRDQEYHQHDKNHHSHRTRNDLLDATIWGLLIYQNARQGYATPYPYPMTQPYPPYPQNTYQPPVAYPTLPYQPPPQSYLYPEDGRP